MHPFQRVTVYQSIERPSLDHFRQFAFERLPIVDDLSALVELVAGASMSGDSGLVFVEKCCGRKTALPVLWHLVPHSEPHD